MRHDVGLAECADRGAGDGPMFWFQVLPFAPPPEELISELLATASYVSC